MKKYKFSKVLLTMIFTLIITTVFSSMTIYYANENIIYEIFANSNIDDECLPVLYEKVPVPEITIDTENVMLNKNGCYWQKQKGGRWNYYGKSVFEEGTYRYHYSFYIPNKYGSFNKYVATALDDFRIHMETEVDDNNYYINGFSKSYEVVAPVINNHKVTFDAKNGTKNTEIVIEHGDRILSYSIPEKENCDFLGWYWKVINVETDLEEEIPFDFSLPIEEDIYIYAKWSYTGQHIKGDMDGNGVIDANDASILLELYKQNDDATEDVELGDMDDNHLIDANDASLILEYYKTH